MNTCVGRSDRGVPLVVDLWNDGVLVNDWRLLHLIILGIV